MIINKSLLIAILVIYATIFSIIVPFSWKPTADSVYVFPQDISNSNYIVGLHYIGSSTIIVASNESRTLIYSSNGDNYIIKGLAASVACSSNNTIVVAGGGSSGGYSALLLSLGERGSPYAVKFSLGNKGIPIACATNEEQSVVLLQDPIEGDRLAILFSNGTGLLYRLPRSLYYMSTVGIRGRSIILGGSNRYAILYYSGDGVLRGVLHNLQVWGNGSVIKLTGVSVGESRLVFYGKMFVGGAQSLSYRAIVLFSDYNSSISRLAMIGFSGANTVSWAVVPRSGYYMVLVEIKGSRLDIVSLSSNGSLVWKPLKITVLAPYVFGRASSQSGIMEVLYTVYPATNASSAETVVLVIRDGGIGVLGANYTLAYIGIGEDVESPYIKTRIINSTVQNVTLEEPRKLPEAVNESIAEAKGARARVYGVIRDSRLLFCASLAAFSSFVVAPVYFGVVASRSFSPCRNEGDRIVAE